MKKITQLLMLSATLAVGFSACKKDETKDYFAGGTNPVLTASVTTNIVLANANRANEAVKLTWTNPNYQFTTGISSQDVSYILEIDTTGANFTNPNKQSIGISKDLSLSLQDSVLNSYLLNQLLLKAGVAHNIEMRIKANLNGAVVMTSNVLKFTVTPYAIPPAVTPPSTGTLFIVGAASPGGWSNPIPAANLAAQTFTKVSPTEYKLTINLIGGAEYKLIGTAVDYSIQYSVAVADTYPNGGPFVANGANSIAPAASGTYIIDVNFQTGKFSVTPQ